MDFVRLIAFMVMEFIHTSHQVNDHPEGINALLDILIKETENPSGNNITGVLKGLDQSLNKSYKNVNDSNIVFVKTQLGPDIFFNQNLTQEKSPDYDPILEDRIPYENNETRPSQEENSESDFTFKPENTRRTFDETIIEELLHSSRSDESDDMILEKEVTFDITEDSQSSKTSPFTSLIDSMARSGAKGNEELLDQFLSNKILKSNAMSGFEDKSDHKSQTQSEIVQSKPDFHNRNKTGKDFDNLDKISEKDEDSELIKILKVTKSKLVSKSAANSQAKSKERYDLPTAESDFTEALDQMVTDEKLKSILESFRQDDASRHLLNSKTDENIITETDIQKIVKNLNILEDWDKKHAFFDKGIKIPAIPKDLLENKSSNKSESKYLKHKIHRSHYKPPIFSKTSFPNVPIPSPYQAQQANLQPTNLIFPQRNMNCCTRTNFIENPLLGLQERLHLINLVNRFTSGYGHVYRPWYYS